MFATFVRRASPCCRILASELAWRFPGAGGGEQIFRSYERTGCLLKLCEEMDRDRDM